jgi:hypothetical protein
MSVGETLRNRRRQRNLSLEYAAQQTRIPLKFLKALEEEKWDVFTARVYLEGFLRRYAGFLALEGDDLVREYRGTPAPVLKASGPAAAREDRQSPSEIPSPLRTEFVFLIGVLALLFGLYVYRAKPFSKNLLPSRHTPALPSSHSAAEGVKSHELRLRTKANVWVRVWTDDHIRFEGTLRAGVMKTWNAREGFRVAASDLSALDLAVGDEVLPVAAEARGEIVWPLPEGMQPEPEAPPPAPPVAAPPAPTPVRTAPRPAPVARPLPAGNTAQQIRPAPLQSPPPAERSVPLAPPTNTDQPLPPQTR